MWVGFLRACAALGIPAGEHSPYDSVLWKRLLRCRLIQSWSFSHVDFCADGGRFRKRTALLFIHCGTPSCRSLQCVDYQINIGEILDKMSCPRWLPECLNALLSLSRTAYDKV